MKQVYYNCAILLGFFAITTNAQDKQASIPELKKNSITLGFHQGGGSVIGLDYERLIKGGVGIQVGVGYLGYGCGLNLHFRNDIKSSFFSFQYWNQGIGDKFKQNLAGFNFVYRSRKHFLTGQAGLGFPLETGPAYPFGKEKPFVALMLAIGFCIPL